MDKKNKESTQATFGWTVIYKTIKGIIEFYRNIYRDYKEERDKINDNINRDKT